MNIFRGDEVKKKRAEIEKADKVLEDALAEHETVCDEKCQSTHALAESMEARTSLLKKKKETRARISSCIMAAVEAEEAEEEVEEEGNAPDEGTSEIPPFGRAALEGA